MEKEDKKFETISDVSVGDVLNEINAESFSYDSDELDLEEILAEFSKNGADERKDEPIFVKKQVEEKIEADIKKSEPVSASQPIIDDEDVLSQDTKGEVRRVDTIIRPWENGVYGDMTLGEPEKNSKKTKKNRNATLSETFDTFTRSELFEEKLQSQPLETRSVEEIIRENNRVSKLLGLRTLLLFILGILSCYLAFSAPLKWFIPRFISYIYHPFRYLFLTAFLQILAMLLSVDIISKGLSRLLKLHPNVDSAITFSSFASLIHVISIMAAPHWKGWLPYSCISVLGLFFAIYGKWINTRAVSRVCKTVRSAKMPSTVHIVEHYGQTNIVKQATEDTRSFISHINDKDASRTFWTFLAPFVIVSSIVFALVSSVGTRTPEHFFWALAAISSVSTPFFTMLSFSHPFSCVAKNLSSIGAAISGWFSARNLSNRANVIVCDEDIFPKGTISLHGLKVLGEFSLEQTVCYAASIIAETKSGLSDVFADLLKSRYALPTNVKNLQYHESGGIEARIGDDAVLVGSAGFMLRSGVKIGAGTNTKNSIFVAINKEAAGVFNVNYKANIEVERALHIMVKKRVPVVLALRDFNLLPMMVEKTFDLPDSSLEYPEIEERIDLSSEEQFINEDACAVITRSGLYPFANAVLASKKLRRATVRNICLTALGAIIGMLLMFYLTFIQKPNLIPPHSVFVYMMMWMIPTYLLSKRVKK